MQNTQEEILIEKKYCVDKKINLTNTLIEKLGLTLKLNSLVEEVVNYFCVAKSFFHNDHRKTPIKIISFDGDYFICKWPKVKIHVETYRNYNSPLIKKTTYTEFCLLELHLNVITNKTLPDFDDASLKFTLFHEVVNKIIEQKHENNNLKITIEKKSRGLNMLSMAISSSFTTEELAK